MKVSWCFADNDADLVLAKIAQKDLALILSELNMIIDVVYEKTKKILVPTLFTNSHQDLTIIFSSTLRIQAKDSMFTKLFTIKGSEFLNQKTQRFVAKEYIFESEDRRD